jgi:anti-sigma factor RsiW
MSCEKYKPALIEAAINGGGVPPAIREHAESCAHCAAELAQQRQLIAAIDANLHRRMNAPVPAAMLRRLEAHLAQHPQPRRSPRLAQIFAGAVATLVTAALILVFLSHWNVATLGPTAKANVVPAHNSGAGQIQVHMGPPAQTTTAPSGRVQASTEKRTRAHIVLASTAASRPEPEVIVPPDERIGLEQFIANLNGRADLPVAIVKPVQEQPEQRIASLKTPDIETAALAVQPLQGSSTEKLERSSE